MCAPRRIPAARTSTSDTGHCGRSHRKVWVAGAAVAGSSVGGMIPALAIGGGTLTLLVFVALGAFIVIGWFSLRRNLRGIDFVSPSDEAQTSPSSPSGRTLVDNS